MNSSIKRGISKTKILTKAGNNKTLKIEDNQINSKEKEALQIKDKSPLLYNRNKDTKPEITPNFNNEIRSNIIKNPRPRVSEIEAKTDSTRQYVNDNKSDKEIENENLKKRVIELEKELNICKAKIKEKDSIIQEKERKILEIENKYKEIKSHVKKRRSYGKNIVNLAEENDDLALALERIHQMENRNSPYNQTSSNQNIPYTIADSFPSLMNRQIMLQNLANRMLILNDMIIPVEQQMINEVCPNPDAMSYEQLLELQEKIGYVDKGLKKEVVEKLPTIKFSKFRSSKTGNFIDKYSNNIKERCTVCQFEFEEGEILRKLNCGHLYHKSCVDDWLLKDKKCPVCKIEVKV